MKYWVFILVLIFIKTVSAVSEPITLNSVVCDLKVDDSSVNGYCLIVIKTEKSPEDLYFYSPLDVDVITEGIKLEVKDDYSYITELNIKNGDTKDIVLKINKNISDHDLNLPLFRFPYPVEKVLIGVQQPRDKFVWRTDFPAYSVDREDKILLQETVDNEIVGQTNSDFTKLRNYLSKPTDLPEYRIYLDKIAAGKEIGIKAWIGKNYQYYLSNTLLVIAISMIMLLVLFFLLKKFVFIHGISTETNLQDKTPAEEKIDWRAIKSRCQIALDKLEGDERIVYKEVFDADGEILQRNLPEKIGFSKAKVTRVLDRLEQKRLIERKSYGVTNKVILK